MIILGLATMGTSAACLMRDGEIVAAIEEERLSRIKNDGAFPLRAIAECLRVAGVTMAEVDAVAVYWKRWRIGTRAAGTLGKAMASPEARRAIAARTRRALIGGPGVESRPEDTGRWSDLFRIRRILRAEFGACPADVTFHDHHLTHQIYGEATRDWPSCLSLSYDGGGEADATVLTPRGERPAHRSQAHPLAELAGAFLQLLHRLARLPHARGRIQDDGAGALRPADLPRRDPRAPAAPRGRRRLPARHAPLRLSPGAGGGFRRGPRGDRRPAARARRRADQGHLDLAASVQAAFEAAQRHLLAWGKAQAPHVDRLVLSGGCALNVTANGRILQSGLFSEIIAPPAPHDAGCAVGAALARGGSARNARAPYLGPGFTDAEIARAFADRGLPAPRAVDEDALIAAIVEALAAGDIVGWFQGRTEFGPRALGSRSILADPRDDAIRETINAKIKKRELFRPFAPSTTIEAAPELFELAQASPYMNILAEVRPEKRDLIPAVTHVDGTARVHTVARDANPLYHRLITAFGAATGVPVLLNTSFNIQEPIVNTPAEAIDTWLRSDMDLLAIGGFLCDRTWREAADAV